MEQNEPSPCFGRLLEGKRHQPIKIAQVRCDEDDSRMGPSIDSGVRHGRNLVGEGCHRCGQCDVLGGTGWCDLNHQSKTDDSDGNQGVPMTFEIAHERGIRGNLLNAF
jgi:hypothetical protein